MANSRRQHANKSKQARNKKKSPQKKNDDTRVEEDQQTPDDNIQPAGLLVVGDAGQEEAKKTMVVLLSQDDVELVVPKVEASRYGTKIEDAIRMFDRYGDAYVPSGSGCNKGYSLIGLAVESDILSKVIHYSNQQASSHPGDWDAAGFVGGLDHAILFHLVLAADYLQNRGLLDLACRTVNDMIHDKSPAEIRHMFGIRPPSPAQGAPPPRRQHGGGELMEKKITRQQKQQLKLEERALRALHTVRCQEFTAYDPNWNAFVPTRFCHLYNFAFFDFDKESEFHRGPPLHEIPQPISDSIVFSCVNFISLKVCESDVGFPVNVFGTVIARDEVDLRCVYLFKREAADSQIITSPDDMLTLMDPCRGLIPDDCIYFEFNLKIKCDGGAVKDFSKGVAVFNSCRVPYDGGSITVGLTSCLSSVELLCADVSQPLEATTSINILKGTCEITRVAAWTTANTNDRIILYDNRAAASTLMTTAGNFIALARRVVAVPLGEKLVLCLAAVVDDEIKNHVLTLGHSDDKHKHVCKMGCSELEVNVAWTAVPKRRKRRNKWENIGKERLLL